MKKRSPYCYTCGNEKEASRAKQSDCLTCHAKKNRESRLNKVYVNVDIINDLLNDHPDFKWNKVLKELVKNKKVDAKAENSGL